MPSTAVPLQATGQQTKFLSLAIQKPRTVHASDFSSRGAFWLLCRAANGSSIVCSDRARSSKISDTRPKIAISPSAGHLFLVAHKDRESNDSVGQYLRSKAEQDESR